MLKESISILIESAKNLGLNEKDLLVSKDYLSHREYGLAFDTIITQLYEYEIEIEEDFYSSLEMIAQKMELPSTQYSCMKELIKG